MTGHELHGERPFASGYAVVETSAPPRCLREDLEVVRAKLLHLVGLAQQAVSFAPRVPLNGFPTGLQGLSVNHPRQSWPHFRPSANRLNLVILASPASDNNAEPRFGFSLTLDRGQ